MEPVLTQTVSSDTKAPSATPVQADNKSEDIVSRVSAFKAQPEKGSDINTSPSQDAIAFNIKDLEKIQDPQARKLAEDAYKSMQADYTRKTQALASERKEMASLKAQLEQSGQFTPSRIQELLNNPSFVQAAREYEASVRQPQANIAQGDLTEEELSYLSHEQQKLYLNQKKMHAETQAMLSNLNNELINVKTQKEDAELSSRYKNYDSNVINQTYKDMMTGKLNATREHLYKAIYHDENVKSAYQMGRMDERNGISQKMQASSNVGGMNTQVLDSDIPLKDKKESFNDYWKRLAASAKTKIGK